MSVRGKLTPEKKISWLDQQAIIPPILRMLIPAYADGKFWWDGMWKTRSGEVRVKITTLT